MSSRTSASAHQYNIHRAASTAVRTFVLVLAAGVVLSFTVPPAYRCTSKILLDDPGRAQQALVDTASPLSDLFMLQGRSIADQIELMKGDKVNSDASKDADIPQDSVTMDVHQVVGTSVVEITVDGSVPTYVERYAKTIPNTFMSFVTGNRRSEISNAYLFAQSRLKEENDHLVEAEVKQEHFAEDNVKSPHTAPYEREMQEMQRNVDLHRGTVDMLIKSVEDLRLRSKMTHDPVLVISPAKQAVQISPPKALIAVYSAILGLILGLFAAGIQLIVRGPRRA